MQSKLDFVYCLHVLLAFKIRRIGNIINVGSELCCFPVSKNYSFGKIVSNYKRLFFFEKSSLPLEG